MKTVVYISYSTAVLLSVYTSGYAYGKEPKEFQMVISTVMDKTAKLGSYIHISYISVIKLPNVSPHLFMQTYIFILISII